MKTKEKIVQEILKECFWDYHIAENDILKIVQGDDKRSKNILFEKILINSQNLFLALSLFKKDELKELLDNYKIPRFNKEYIQKRKDIVEFFLFSKKLNHKELLWTI